MFGIAEVYYSRDNYNSAKKYYHRFLEYSSDSTLYPYAINNICFSELSTNNYKGFYDLWSRTNTEYFDSLMIKRYYLNAASYFRKLYQHDSAIVYFKKVFNYDQNDYYAQYLSSISLFETGRIEDALSGFLRVINTCKGQNDQSDVYTYIGICYSLLNNNENSIKYFQEALRKTSDNANAMYQLALEYNKSGNNSAAMLEAEKLKKIDKEKGILLIKMLR